MILVCPDCRGRLGADLRCAGCGRAWGYRAGFPALVDDARVTGSDRFMRRIYDGLPALHDPLTKHLLPRLQRDASEEAMREAYLARLALHDRPARILEVGVGTGANLPRLAAAARGAEIVGVDLSVGMIRHARRRARRLGLEVSLLLADAHHLPFEDASFDRVFHVGALGSFRDPALALAEFARVAVPGSPIVVVDEELDPTRTHRRRDRLAFRLLTFYDTDPGCPIDKLPPGAEVVEHVAISRFYYCLVFRVPSAASTRRTVAP